MTDWRVATHSWLHTFLGWNGPYYLLALHMFFRFLKITGRPKLFHFSFFFPLQKPEPVVLSFFLNFKRLEPRVITSVGQFLNAHPILKPVLTMRTNSNIYIHTYIYIYIQVRTDQGINILNFCRFTQFSDRVVLAYTITVGFQNWDY